MSQTKSRIMLPAMHARTNNCIAVAINPLCKGAVSIPKPVPARPIPSGIAIASPGYQRPDRPISCKRRQVTASDGKSVTREATLDRISGPSGVPVAPLISVSRPLATRPTTSANSINHQNSDREARPEKVKYFLKQVLTDSMRVIAEHLPPGSTAGRSPTASFCQKQTRGLRGGG